MSLHPLRSLVVGLSSALMLIVGCGHSEGDRRASSDPAFTDADPAIASAMDDIARIGDFATPDGKMHIVFARTEGARTGTFTQKWDDHSREGAWDVQRGARLFVQLGRVQQETQTVYGTEQLFLFETTCGPETGQIELRPIMGHVGGFATLSTAVFPAGKTDCAFH